MNFDYEIPVEEYAAAQVLYSKACGKGQVLKQAIGWVLLGLFFVLIAVFRWAADWAPILLLLTGVWFIYGGIRMLFPTRHYRRYYPQSGLAGKKYHAELDENGFSVSGDACSWRSFQINFRIACDSGGANGQRELRFLFSAGRRSAHFRMASSVGQRDWPQGVRQYSTFGGTWG